MFISIKSPFNTVTLDRVVARILSRNKFYGTCKVEKFLQKSITGLKQELLQRMYGFINTFSCKNFAGSPVW